MFSNTLNKLNNKGIGLVGVMVAAALVLVAALTVSRFISDQYKLSTRLEISGNCQTIANSIVEYIKKDEASLFISSYGPTPGETTYPAGLDVTDDGVDRFRFGPTPINAYVSSSGTSMTIPSTSVPLPAGWKYYNHLNIRNSVNRLVALAASDNYCCDSLNMSNGTCGTLFYSDTKSVPGFTITDKNVEVRLAAAFEGQSCVGRRLAMADVPDSRSDTKVNFKVRVTTRRGTPQEQSCEGSGSVQRSPDSSGSLTVLQYDTNLCGASQAAPAICGGTPSIQIRVRSFKNASASECQSNCLMQTTSEKTCAEINAGELSLFNTLANPACTNTANCLESEPGTAFLCRIGEHSWMQANPNFWEPCETASIRDADGSIIGPVQIEYVPALSGNTRSQRSSQAIITLTNLRNMRGYSADVRAVDTAGNIGPAFCGSMGSPSCNATRPHFTVLDAVVTLGPITDTVNRVGPVSQNVVGRSTTLTGTTRYQNALNVFQPDNFQCQDGAPALRTQISYNPALPGGFVPTHQCTASYQHNGGAAVNLPADQCTCTTTECTAQMPNLGTRGTYELTISPTNDCGPIPKPPATPPVLSWCLDDNPTVAVNHAATINGGPTPNFNSIISNISTATKACGVATMCPKLDGTFGAVKGTSCSTVNTGWQEMVQSGCLADPSGNYCAVVFDPCGRYGMTNDPPPAIRYSSTLRGVTHTATAAANQCFRFGGVQVGGNQCEPGAFCSRTGKCYNTCAKEGLACGTDSTICDDASYGVTSAQAGGPRCVGGFCTCPTNRYSPAANNCSQKYCPELNSCPGNIGSNPPTVGACVACSNWNVGPWSLCVNGNKTRSVSCPTGCCIGPEPDSSSTCPDCVSPWGTEVLDGASITAYQTATVGCGETCASETRTCNNGTLSGSFTRQSCSVDACVEGCWVCSSASEIGTRCPLNPDSCNVGDRYDYRTDPCPGAPGNPGTCDPIPVFCMDKGACTDPNLCDVAACTGAPASSVCGPAHGGSFVTAAEVNTAGLCSQGSPNPSVILGAGPWNWTCNGGGLSVNCSATRTFGGCFGRVMFPYSNAGMPGYACQAAPVNDECLNPCTNDGEVLAHPYMGCNNAACVCQCLTPPPAYPPNYGACSMQDLCTAGPGPGSFPNHEGCCFVNACGPGTGFSGRVICAQNPDGTWGFDRIDCSRDPFGTICE